MALSEIISTIVSTASSTLVRSGRFLLLFTSLQSIFQISQAHGSKKPSCNTPFDCFGFSVAKTPTSSFHKERPPSTSRRRVGGGGVRASANALSHTHLNRALVHTFLTRLHSFKQKSVRIPRSKAYQVSFKIVCGGTYRFCCDFNPTPFDPASTARCVSSAKRTASVAKNSFTRVFVKG